MTTPKRKPKPKPATQAPPVDEEEEIPSNEHEPEHAVGFEAPEETSAAVEPQGRG